MYRFIDHSKVPNYNIEVFNSDDVIEIMRPLLFFASGQHLTYGKLKEYFTDKAIIKFKGDGFIMDVDILAEPLILHSVVYNETEIILGKAVYSAGLLLGRAIKPDEDILNNLRIYAEQYLSDDEFRVKTLYTMLIILKPYKNSDIIKPIFNKLVELRKIRRKK